MSEADKEIDIKELKKSLKLWIKKWKQERENTDNKEEKIKLTSEIFLAQWIVNSKKGYGVDITRILREDSNRGVNDETKSKKKAHNK